LSKELIEKISKAKAQEEDKAILQAIIGSKIIDIKVEHIKNRKHMVIVTITHDGASSIPIGRNAVANTNPIKLRVRL
jgi:hypothetical protein